MRYIQPLLAAVLVAASSASTNAANGDDNILSSAVRLRLKSVAPVVIDPAVLDLKLMAVDVAVDATNRASAVSQLKTALEPRGLSVVDQGGNVWVTKRDVETDLSRQIALVVNSTNYRQLAVALSAEARRNRDPRLQKLSEMAEFMASQATLPDNTRQFIKEKTEKIKHLQFMQKNALSGSSLSPPDPARARALELDIDKLRNEVDQYYDKLADRFKASVFNPAEPATAPPAVYSVREVVPPVIFNKLALDSMQFYTESLEMLLRSATSLGFEKNQNNSEDRSSLSALLELIKKQQIDNRALVAEYLDLLRQAGLVSGASASVGPQGAVLGVEAANKLFNFFEDRREAVRIAIGRSIMNQLENLAQDIGKGNNDFLAASGISEMFLFGEKEIGISSQALGGRVVGVRPYSRNGNDRVGAITGLVAFAEGGGETSTISVQLEALKKAGGDPKRSLRNLFGSSTKLVALNTTADLAVVDDMLIGKGGAAAMSDSAYLGGGGFIGSVGEALDLVKNSYDPGLFKSLVVVGLDSNYDIKIAGDSGGVAMALAALSTVRSKPVDRRLMVTGAVRQFGDVRPVGGIYGKGMAAIESGTLALMVPVSNLGEMLNLPTAKVVTRHFITLSHFKDAASVAGLDLTPESKAVLEAICLHNFSLAAIGANKFPEALSLLSKAVELYPDHISAQVLKAILAAAGVVPASEKAVSEAKIQAAAFANTMSTNPTAARSSSTAAVPATAASGLAAIIPDFTVNNASGEEAFDLLNDKAKLALGQSPNITIRTRNEFFDNEFINLSVQNITVQEILKQLCDLCDAKFQIKGNVILVDSIRPPNPGNIVSNSQRSRTPSDSQPEQSTGELKAKLDGASKAQVREYFGGKKPDAVIGEDIWAYGGRWSDPDSGVIFKKAVFYFTDDTVSNITFQE